MTERVIFSSKHINHIYHYFVSVIAHVITYNAALALALLPSLRFLSVQRVKS